MSLFKRHPKKLFVNNLRDTRENLQLTVQQVAEYGKVTPETIEKIESGEYTPSVVLALRIAELLSRPVGELFPLQEPEPVAPVKEERIEHEVARASNVILLTAAFAALFVGFVLEFFPSTEVIGYTLFGVWVVLAFSYLTAQMLVKGQRRWSLKVARQTSRKKAILTTIWTSALYGALVIWAPWSSEDRPQSFGRGIVQFLELAAPWGLFMYYFNYGMWRKGKGGWLEGKDVKDAMKK